MYQIQKFNLHYEEYFTERLFKLGYKQLRNITKECIVVRFFSPLALYIDQYLILHGYLHYLLPYIVIDPSFDFITCRCSPQKLL